MFSISRWGLTVLLLLTPSTSAIAADAPDIRSVPADLIVPEASHGPPAAGQRRLVTDTVSGTNFTVYLPSNWSAAEQWPVIIELPGNGGYRSRWGDTCSGRPEDCRFGYGVTAGMDAIWICVPFLNGNGDRLAVTWWGDAPAFETRPTVDLLKRVIDFACHPNQNGDRSRVVLAGFSRGSIACNRIGLSDDDIASSWCGMICYSHYDGVRPGWPYPDADRASALKRLQRLGNTPQFICHESDAGPAVSLSATQAFLHGAGVDRHLTFCETGFRNHSDQWVLRPSPARRQLRRWFRRLMNTPPE